MPLTMDDIVKLANPHTNIIILEEEQMAVTMKYIDDEETEGPECHLCKKNMFSVEQKMIYKNQTYTLISTGDLIDNKWTDMILQCSYCFNFYHRLRCNLSMSEVSYMKAIRTRGWSCPTCVPEFHPIRKIEIFRQKKTPHTSKDILLIFFKLLHKLNVKCVTICEFDKFCESIILYISNSDPFYDFG